VVLAKLEFVCFLLGFQIFSCQLTESWADRIAGASTEINALRDCFNRGRVLAIVPGCLLLTNDIGECPIEPSTDIHAVCDLIKYWFRVLPEPVFPPSSYFQVIEAMSKSNQLYHLPSFSLMGWIELEDFDARLDKIRNIVQSLPPANFDLLKRVAEHLDKYVYIITGTRL
jgi:hypothetical protein